MSELKKHWSFQENLQNLGPVEFELEKNRQLINAIINEIIIIIIPESRWN